MFEDNEELKINVLSYQDFFPDEIASQLEALNIIPIIQNDKMQFLMPYKINIK